MKLFKVSKSLSGSTGFALALWYVIMNSLLYMVLPVTYIVIIDVALYCIVNTCITLKMKPEA